MRKIFLLILFTGITLEMYSQPYVLDDFFENHRLGDNVIKINIGPLLIRMGSWFVEEPALKYVMRKSRRARILYSTSPEGIEQRDISNLIREIDKEGYKNLLFIRNKEEKIDLYAREMKGKIRKLLVVFRANDEFVLADLDCRIHEWTEF